MARLSGLIIRGGVDKTMLDLIHPVDSLYFTLGDENPSISLGGVWTKLTGGVLALAGTLGYAAAGSVGGSKKISVEQMPNHEHYVFGRPNLGSFNGVGIYPTMGEFGSLGFNDKFEQNMPLARGTGGGQTTIPCTSPSTSGEGRRSPAGGAQCLRSGLEAEALSSRIARIGLETFCSQPSRRTPASNIRELLGRFTRKTGSRLGRVPLMLSETPAVSPLSLCRFLRCQVMNMSFKAITMLCSSVTDGQPCLASRMSISTIRREARSLVRWVETNLMRTALLISPSTYGGAPHKAEVVA